MRTSPLHRSGTAVARRTTSSPARRALGAATPGKPTCPPGQMQRLDTAHGLDGDGPEPVAKVTGSWDYHAVLQLDQSSVCSPAQGSVEPRRGVRVRGNSSHHITSDKTTAAITTSATSRTAARRALDA